MIKTKAKREIETILKKSITPGTYEYIQIKTAPKKLPVAIYQTILGIKEESNLKFQLSYERFDDLFSEFQKKGKKDFESASQALLNGIDQSLASASFLSDMTRKKKGQKKVRSEDWNIYKKALNILEDKNETALIILMSYLLQTGRIKGLEDMFKFYGISPDECEKPEIEMATNKLKLFEELFNALKLIPTLLRKHKNALMWFVDVFKEDARYYLDDWEKYKRRSHNEPDYQKSYKKVVAKINEATPAELGYTYLKPQNYSDLDGVVSQRRRVNRYSLFLYQHAPQGLFKLLYRIHQVLFWAKNYEDRITQKKLAEVRGVFKDVSYYLYRKIIRELYQKEFTHHSYPELDENIKRPKTFREAVLEAARTKAEPDNIEKAKKQKIENELGLFSPYAKALTKK